MGHVAPTAPTGQEGKALAMATRLRLGTTWIDPVRRVRPWRSAYVRLQRPQASTSIDLPWGAYAIVQVGRRDTPGAIPARLTYRERTFAGSITVDRTDWILAFTPDDEETT